MALVDDYELVLVGVAHLLEPYADRIAVVELDPDSPVTVDVDIALYDTFAQSEADRNDLDLLVSNPLARRVVVYTWCFDPYVVDIALEKGADGYLSKALPASELVESLLRVHAGETVVSNRPGRIHAAPGLDWPGRHDGLSQRESEIIALITQGRRNTEIAEMTYLNINTIKTYIRSAYRKLGITSRSQAVLWGVANGFHPPQRRLDGWRVGEVTA